MTRDMEHAFCSRKFYATQNVMADVDFDLRFTCLGWLGGGNTSCFSFIRYNLDRVKNLHVSQGNKLVHFQSFYINLYYIEL